MRRDLLAKRVSGSSEHGGPQEATSGLVPPGALEALPEQGMPHAKLLEELRAVAHADKGVGATCPVCYTVFICMCTCMLLHRVCFLLSHAVSLFATAPMCTNMPV